MREHVDVQLLILVTPKLDLILHINLHFFRPDLSVACRIEFLTPKVVVLGGRCLVEVVPSGDDVLINLLRDGTCEEWFHMNVVVAGVDEGLVSLAGLNFGNKVKIILELIDIVTIISCVIDEIQRCIGGFTSEAYFWQTVAVEALDTLFLCIDPSCIAYGVNLFANVEEIDGVSVWDLSDKMLWNLEIHQEFLEFDHLLVRFEC